MNFRYPEINFYIPKEESSCYVSSLFQALVLIKEISDFYTNSISRPPGIFEWKEFEIQYVFNERSKIIVFHSSYIIYSFPKRKSSKENFLEQIESCF